jgi:ABC-type sulfate transport system substrate-binding protein
LPKPLSEGGAGGININPLWLFDYERAVEKAIYPAFAAKAKREHNIDIHFTSSFAGSETVTNQILQGVKAQVAILSIERDADRLKQGGFCHFRLASVATAGHRQQDAVVILVRKGNPKVSMTLSISRSPASD